MSIEDYNKALVACDQTLAKYVKLRVDGMDMKDYKNALAQLKKTRRVIEYLKTQFLKNNK
jgi:hypothetical protein